MNISAPFIARPTATTLLTIGLALAGIGAFFLLPVSPMPDVDYPTISVSAQLPGASPATVATSVATPLERHLGTIAGVNEMTSSSSVGSARITLQFDLDRDVDGAARDVQAAINAARVDLPAALRSNPTYRKVNPADAPIMILTLTSDTLTPGRIYNSASTVLQQKLLQVQGIGDVTIGGSSLPAVRVEINPHALTKYGISLEDVRAAISAANANSPKGAIEDSDRRYQIYVNDTGTIAADYQSLVVAYRGDAAVRLSDVAEITDSVENLRNLGLANGKPSISAVIFRQPGANIISVVDRVRALIPELQASIPGTITINAANDRTRTIRASLRDIEHTLLIAIGLVILVTFLFLRQVRSALIPSVAVPLSLIGTFGAMYLAGFSIDNLSLMALTVATGFVVDDAIVVLENIMRHIEAGVPRYEAALLGAEEVGFTVLSMSVSLIAVFLPILLMGGLVGRIFREFALTLSFAIAVSLVISLTTTPMMCAYILRENAEDKQGFIMRGLERGFNSVQGFYDRTLKWSLVHRGLVAIALGIAIVVNVYLFITIPKGFFPQQDTGALTGGLRADQSASFQSVSKKFTQFMSILQSDPAVESVVGFAGGGATNSGNVFIQLKPLAERKISADQIIARLRRKLSDVAGARLFLQAVQDVRAGGRQGNAQYQYVVQTDDLQQLESWTPRISAALQKLPQIADANSDQQDKGLDVELKIDRNSAARLGLSMTSIDNTLYDAFGQRQVSTIYSDFNQYHVVMEIAPEFWQSPETLRDLYVSTSGNIGGSQSTALANVSPTQSPEQSTTTGTLSSTDSSQDAARNQALNQLTSSGHGGVSSGSSVSTRIETMVPLSAFSHYEYGSTPLSINHQGPFVATAFSFNLPPGESLSTATTAIRRAMDQLHVPQSIHGSFAGTAQVFQSSLSSEPLLVTAAIVAVYIVLGILYESLIHPLTILSTLPSAGAGAVLALRLFGMDFSLIALIGVILLIGIVKKNAIMMIDVALQLEREEGKSAHDAIYCACLRRFRPILMTTMAAILGAAPLALFSGEGAEMRRPLAISIIGGLIVSQALTLYTTPVVYLYLDGLGDKGSALWHRMSSAMIGRFKPRRVRA